MSESQKKILIHTRDRAAHQRYCGSSADMDALVEAGFMRELGKPEWAIDSYYTITPKGLAEIAGVQ